MLEKLRNLKKALGKKTRPAWKYPSEVSKCRARLAPYCKGHGLDLGFGGDPIVSHAICVDLPKPYARYQSHSLHLTGDARSLVWFQDGVLDFVFSSHLLEDFEETEPVLREWLRVLKSGGHLVLYCPDEAAYRRHCSNTGQPYNEHHKIEDFSLEKVKALLQSMQLVDFVHENPLIEVYSWELVCRKR